jgi:hypothetical protein
VKPSEYIVPGVLILGVYYLVTAKDWAMPSSRDNIIYKAVNAIGDVFDNGEDDNSFNLGASIYYWLNPVDPNFGYNPNNPIFGEDEFGQRTKPTRPDA